MADSHKPLVVVCEVYPRLYGAQRSLLTLYQRWHESERFRLHFAYFVEGELSEAIRNLGIESTRLTVGPLLGSFNKRLLRLRAWDYPRLGLELASHTAVFRRFLLEIGADLLHCNNDRAGLVSFPGAHWARCPMVTHIRRDRSFGELDKLIHWGTTELVWVSRRIRDEFARNNDIQAVKGRVIYNGRDLLDRDGPGTHHEIRDEFGIPRDSWLALVAAGLGVWKGHDTLVRAAHIACRNESRLYFLLAGIDPTPDQQRRRKIEAMVRDAGLSGRVLLLGHRRDIGRLMRGIDVLVNPSMEEALSGALIEALGYGVPCVATDTGGTAEIVEPGQCGFLVPRQDHEALAERIVELLRDEATRRVFSENARNRFDEKFTAAKCADETAAFFDEIIARHQKAPHRRRHADQALHTAADQDVL